MKIPKHTEGRVYWNESEGGHVFLLVGYCPDTLAYFTALYEHAKKTFPDLKSEDVTCGKIQKSRDIYGFTFIKFPIAGKRRDIEGYTERREIDFSY